MASTPSSADPTSVPLEVPSWLKSLPLAPEYHPTLAEFADPIAYILKIEKEASSFGICKIVPPLPPPPKKATISNLNRSFAARDPSLKKPPTFTTRQQQIGFCPRRPRPVQKPVWQSGEFYTLQQFEAKAKLFERSQLKRFSRRNPFLPLELESLFWNACADKPFSVEYANDMPGSAFSPVVRRKWCKDDEAANVGESEWNMRGVSRAKGSLLRYMREDIPGVTSPMVYVAMIFSWFAWHVEDHELHSLNYLHFGAGKTWYGVPRDARSAFEEVVRVHGYGGEVNPLVTFTILGEKTTVMSPEVLISAGIPCCRLVQNAGEFVVTFPGAYHSGFSHGFNCAEAANIATPAWLKVAKEAAIRRASINYPPMVSHFQLLYALALSLCSRMPISGVSEPRSSRLKDKMKGEGEVMIKEIFVQNVVETNDLLSALVHKGSSCIVLPHNSSNNPLYSNSLVRSQLKMKPRLSLGLCSREEALEASRNFPSTDIMLGRNAGFEHINFSCPVKGNSAAVASNKSETGTSNSPTSDLQHAGNEKESPVQLDQGLLSCVTCGILSFTCVAVVHPSEAAARYIVSADCGFLNDQNIVSAEISDLNNKTNLESTWNLLHGSGRLESYVEDGADGELAPCSTHAIHSPDHNAEDGHDAATKQGASALALLASAYGDSSDSEVPPAASLHDDEHDTNYGARSASKHLLPSCQGSPLRENSTCLDHANGSRNQTLAGGCQLKSELSDGSERGMLDNSEESGETETSSSSLKSMEEVTDDNCRGPDSSCHTSGSVGIHQTDVQLGRTPSGSFRQHDVSSGYKSTMTIGNSTKSLDSFDTIRKNSIISVTQRSDKDSSRMHVFCLEHALEVEKLLRPIGGVNIMILCHPDYPKIEAEAKLLAEGLGIDYEWKCIDFRETTLKDQERIREALDDEESIPTNSDWAVKLGINLYFSANLSKSPLYSKQMPYNAVIYRAFGCSSPSNSPVKPRPSRRKLGRKKRIVVAGKWCGKVWMSNQVHPYLTYRDDAQGQTLEERLHSPSSTSTKSDEDESEGKNRTSFSKKSFSVNKIPAAKRSGKRKKRSLVREAAKKAKSTPQVTEKKVQNNEHSSQISSTQSGRVLRACRKLNSKYEDEAVPKSTRSSGKANVNEEFVGGSTPRSVRKLNLEDEPKSATSTRMKTRASRTKEAKTSPAIVKKQTGKRKARKAKAAGSPGKAEDEEEVGEYTCDIEGCLMSFSTKHDLSVHKKDICPEKGCGKKFFSHKYLLQHRKVHMDDRPLECPWKGCTMRFKWAWARTEHIRVHTGDRPYICRECGQTFRFVSDFSRHKRKTGHLVKKGRR